MNLPPQAPEFALRTSKMRVWDWRGWRLNWDWRIVGLEELEGLEGLDAKPNWTLEGLECGIGGVGGSLEAQLGHWDLEGGSLERPPRNGVKNVTDFTSPILAV